MNKIHKDFVRIKSRKIKLNLLQYCDKFDAIRRFRILDKTNNIRNVILRNYYNIINIPLRKTYQYIIKPTLYKKNVHILDFIVHPKDVNKGVSFELFFEGLEISNSIDDYTTIVCPFPIKLKVSKEEENLIKKMTSFYIQYTNYKTEAFLYGSLYELKLQDSIQDSTHTESCNPIEDRV